MPLGSTIRNSYDNALMKSVITRDSSSSEYVFFFLHFVLFLNIVHSLYTAGAFYDITVTSLWARWRLKSPASWLITQLFVQAQIKESIKSPRHWPLWESPGDWWIPRKKGQYRRKCFNLMTSSWTHEAQVARQWGPDVAVVFCVVTVWPKFRLTGCYTVITCPIFK